MILSSIPNNIVISFLHLSGACSHNRANTIWIESINSSKGFTGTECGSYEDYKAGKCDSNPQQKMGYSCTSTPKSGKYFFDINEEAPFAQGWLQCWWMAVNKGLKKKCEKIQIRIIYNKKSYWKVLKINKKFSLNSTHQEGTGRKWIYEYNAANREG